MKLSRLSLDARTARTPDADPTVSLRHQRVVFFSFFLLREKGCLFCSLRLFISCLRLVPLTLNSFFVTRSLILSWDLSRANFGTWSLIRLFDFCHYSSGKFFSAFCDRKSVHLTAVVWKAISSERRCTLVTRKTIVLFLGLDLSNVSKTYFNEHQETKSVIIIKTSHFVDVNVHNVKYFTYLYAFTHTNTQQTHTYTHAYARTARARVCTYVCIYMPPHFAFHPSSTLRWPN